MANDPDTYQRILIAAESVVLAQGVAALTFDKVAKAAEVSRGGVLYHFKSKEALVEAMVERFVSGFETAIDDLVAKDREPVGRFSRAYIRASFEPVAPGDLDRLGSCIIAALNNEPDQLEPLRAQHRRWQKKIEDDGLDPVTATIIRHAVDGLWLGEAFTTNKLAAGMRAKVIARLLEMCAAPAKQAKTA